MQVNVGQSGAPAPTPQLTVASGQISTQGLSPGQQLAATVLATGPNGQVSLNINNTQINASTNLVLTEGQLLNLIVAQTGQQTILKLSDASLHAALLSQALRTSLPKQGSLTDILSNLRAVVQQSTRTQTETLAQAQSTTNTPQPTTKVQQTIQLPPLPAGVQQAAKKLIDNLPQPRQLNTAQGVKEALKNSGLFLEDKLKNLASQESKQPTQSPAQAKNITQDFKNNLLQLRQELVRAISTPQGKQTTTDSTQGQAIQTQNIAPQLTTISENATPVKQQQQLAIQQLRQLISLDIKNVSQQLPKESVERLTHLFKQLETLPALTTAKSADQITLPTKALELIQSLKPELKALIVQLAPLPPTPALTSLKSNLGALDNLFMQLFGAGKKAQTAQSQPPPPLPRAPLQAQSPPPPSLLNLNDTQQALQEMLRQTDSALARMQGQQSGSLLEQEAGRLLLNAEIPLRRGEQIDLLQLRIQEEEPQSDKEKFEQGITVTLSLDLEGTGPVYAKINVRKENVSVVFWAEEQDTLTTATEHMEELEQRLTRVGLKPDQMSFLPGKPPQKDEQQSLLNLGTQLLDVKA